MEIVDWRAITDFELIRIVAQETKNSQTQIEIVRGSLDAYLEHEKRYV